MKEEIVSFETAKLAKKKGFSLHIEDNIQLYQWYDENGKLHSYETIVSKKFGTNPYRKMDASDFEAKLISMDNSLDNVILAPTQSLLQKWLREKHNIEIIIKPIYDYVTLKVYSYTNSVLNRYGAMQYDSSETTYEETLEKGLQEALKLIKK